VSAKVTPAPSSPGAAAAPAAGRRQWCVPKPAADEMVLQENIDFACGQEGVDCAAIRPGGVCYEPDTVQGHAAYAMNLYFQSNGQHAYDCDFGQTGVVTTADPSKIDLLPIRRWSSDFFCFLYFVSIKKNFLAHAA